MIYKTLVVLLLSLVWGLVVFTPVFADDSNIIPSGGNINFAFSPNPVGSGARALGFGAFIAVADDATAASWNPGGLVQLKTAEISIVGNYSSQNTSYTFSEANGSQSTSLTDLNYLSFAYPFTLWNRNMVVSINYQRLYDFTREASYQFKNPVRDPVTRIPYDGLYYDTQESYHQSGSLSAIGIAYGFEIIPRHLSVGITINIWDDDLCNNSWEQTVSNSYALSLLDVIVDEFKYAERHNFIFKGLNYNLGLLWHNKNRKFSLGAVFKSPFTADLKHKFDAQITDAGFESTHLTKEEKLEMPMSYGIGAAYRFSDRFSISADVYRTHWEDFLLQQEDGTKISAVTAKSEEQSDVDPTCQVRLGAEYLFINKNKHYVIPLRMGLFYDPSPADNNPDDFYGFSLGTGFAKGKFVFDIATQYRFGRNVGNSIIPSNSFSQDVDEFKVYSSIIIHWD